MFAAAMRAQRAILRNFETIAYNPTPESWRAIKKGIKRDLQAQYLRPNVPIPPRRQILTYLAAMRQETGSARKALASLFHDGTWTSSGGSFRLAEELEFDLLLESDRRLRRNGQFRYLEIGGAWAGLKGPQTSKPRDIAGLARHFDAELGQRVFLHFTNLTRWHPTLPDAVIEHPFVTAAGLTALSQQGVNPQSVDIIYSQAAAYFETDPKSFLAAAAGLLSQGGLLIFNHQPQHTECLIETASASNLRLLRRRMLGGMNGIVAAFEKETHDTTPQAMIFHHPRPSQQNPIQVS